LTTTQQCDACHSSTAWLPATFDHTTNSEVIPWRFPYAPTCAGCHADEYEADEHTKTKNPRIFYTVSELSDCSGACHEYTDSTFTTIKKARYGEHKVSDGDFD
jgi:hypothetical protein